MALRTDPRSLYVPPGIDRAPGHAPRCPVEHERVHAAASAIVTAVPFLCLGFVAWQVWDRALHWHDLVVFAATYIPIGLGVTVGFHRHFTHRSFKAPRWLRGCSACLGPPPSRDR